MILLQKTYQSDYQNQMFIIFEIATDTIPAGQTATYRISVISDKPFKISKLYTGNTEPDRIRILKNNYLIEINYSQLMIISNFQYSFTVENKQPFPIQFLIPIFLSLETSTAQKFELTIEKL
jgi:hypothetical protein